MIDLEKAWSFELWAPRIAALPENFAEEQWPPADWILHDGGDVTVAYAPFGWMNQMAKIAFVGITPGRHQAWKSTMEARRALTEGADHNETLRRANAMGAFSGPMRANLVRMLDEIGVATCLKLSSTAQLFSTAHHLTALTSAIRFPVFVDGANYTGSRPRLNRSPLLQSLVRQTLGPSLADAPNALVVPLGDAARTAVEMLIADELVSSSRCLFGFPHPSGANGWRVRQFAKEKDQLSKRVSEWFD